MRELLRFIGTLIAVVVWGGIVYAVCVIWPLRLNHTIGLAAGGVVAIVSLAGYFIGLAKRLKAEA